VSVNKSLALDPYRFFMTSKWKRYMSLESSKMANPQYMGLSSVTLLRTLSIYTVSSLIIRNCSSWGLAINCLILKGLLTSWMFLRLLTFFMDFPKIEMTESLKKSWPTFRDWNFLFFASGPSTKGCNYCRVLQ